MQCTDTISMMLCQSLYGQQQDMSAFWTRVSGCLTRLTIEVPVEDLSACCISMAPLVALQQLELSCDPAPTWERSKVPAQQIATPLPQLECLFVSHIACDVALHVDGPELRSLRLFNMPQIVGLRVSAPRLKDLTLRDVHVQPAQSRNGRDRLMSLISAMSELANLELLQTPYKHQDGVRELVHLSRLTRLVTTRVYRTAIPSLPNSLRRLILTHQDLNLPDAATYLASRWHLESLHSIAPDPKGQLFNPDQDVPWGMSSVREWHWSPHPDKRHLSDKKPVLQVDKKPEADLLLPNHEHQTSLICLYRRHEEAEQHILRH